MTGVYFTDTDIDHAVGWWTDPILFDESAREKFIQLPESERVNFVVGLLEEFYSKNIEYANFMQLQIHRDPMLLLEFFQGVKKSHFKKCGIPDKGRFAEMQKQIKEAEIEIARNPINYDDIKLVDIWPIIRIRNPFNESELSRLYYVQHPRKEDLSTDLIANQAEGYYIPFGPYLFLMSDAITHAAAKRNFKFEVTKGGRKKSDRTKSLEIVPVKNGFELTQHKKGESATITIINKELIQSTTAMKLFVFLLAKANQQHFNPVISFPLQDLVSIGMYSNITNARAGFKNHISAVQSLQIAGNMKKGKRHIKQTGGVLFYNHDIDQNNVKVWVNENFDIEFLASYYTMLPVWAWALSDNSFEILLYAFMKSRTERSDKFNISLSIIREKLTLPTREEYALKGKKWKPGQYVKKPIIDAISGIKAAIDANKDANISIQEHYIVNDANLDDWLKGYISVSLAGDYSAKLMQIREKQIKIIEANTERKEAARAMVEAQKEAEKNDNSQ